MITISVAMATYNGAIYLREQLDSFLIQTHTPSELVICDDGSVDETIEIIREFSESSPFPVRLHRNEKNLGYEENFLKAARLCQGDWVAFCDQDDVWLPNKLEDVRNIIENNMRPIMILQNAYICDENLAHEGRLFPNRLRPGYYAPGSQYGFWVWLGCLQTIRADVFRFLNQQNLPANYFPGHRKMSHDKWTCMIANTIGGFQVIEGAAALYRRHDRALTGTYAEQTVAARIKKSLPVSGDHYRFLSGAAEETAIYLDFIAKQADGQTKICFEQGARAFERISKIQDRRADLYYSDSLVSRAENFLQILASGGYIGPTVSALGWKSGAKDILQMIGVFSAQAQRSQ